MGKDKKLSEIKEIIKKHKGKGKQISAGKIAEMLNLKQEDTHVEPRALILETIKQYRIPIAGGSKGYYLITNKVELEEYTKSLEKRIKNIKNRKRIVETVFDEYYKQ